MLYVIDSAEARPMLPKREKAHDQPFEVASHGSSLLLVLRTLCCVNLEKAHSDTQQTENAIARLRSPSVVAIRFGLGSAGVWSPRRRAQP